MGLMANVYRNADRYESSDNGTIARFDHVCVMEYNGKPVYGPVEPSDDCPAVRLILRLAAYGPMRSDLTRRRIISRKSTSGP